MMNMALVNALRAILELSGWSTAARRHKIGNRLKLVAVSEVVEARLARLRTQYLLELLLCVGEVGRQLHRRSWDRGRAGDDGALGLENEEVVSGVAVREDGRAGGQRWHVRLWNCSDVADEHECHGDGPESESEADTWRLIIALNAATPSCTPLSPGTSPASSTARRMVAMAGTSGIDAITAAKSIS